MLLNAYSVYDVKALSFSPPFYQPSDGLAVRMLTELARDTNTSIGKYPADFTLYCVGQFDDGKGVLLPFETRRHIIDAVATLPTPKE